MARQSQRPSLRFAPVKPRTALTTPSTHPDDPFRWMESPSTERDSWIHAQHECARHLAEAYTKQIVTETERLASLGAAPVERRAGTRTFRFGRVDANNLPSLHVLDEDSTTWRVLYDPNLLPDDTRATPTTWYEFPDGKRVIMRLSQSANDKGGLKVLDVDSAEFLSDSIPASLYPVMYEAGVPWSRLLTPHPHGRLFWYVRCEDPNRPLRNFRVFEHRIGTGWEHEIPLSFEPCLGELDLPELLSLSPSGEFLALTIRHATNGTDGISVYLWNTQTQKPARRIVSPHGNDLNVARLSNTHLYLWTTTGADRGQILRQALKETHEPISRWQTVVSEDERTILNFWIMEPKIIIQRFRHGFDVIETCNLNGTGLKKLTIPEQGTFAQVSLHNQEVGLTITTPSVPYVRRVVSLSSGESEMLEKKGAPGLMKDPFSLTEAWAKSQDGTRVPLLIYTQKGAPQTPRPTVLVGYGGYGLVYMRPQFLPYLVSWVLQGGVWAVVGLRGGGELGNSWHEAGRKKNKHRAFEDLAGAAHFMNENGYSTPSSLGLAGSSLGGTVALATALRYQGLAGAVMAHTCLTDMERFSNFENDPSNMGPFYEREYGSPSNPEELSYLRSWSPYHNIPATGPVPHILLVASPTDTRVPAWHAYKMIARLERDRPDTGPHYLFPDKRVVHGGAHTLSRNATLVWAEVLGCLYTLLSENLLNCR